LPSRLYQLPQLFAHHQSVLLVWPQSNSSWTAHTHTISTIAVSTICIGGFFFIFTFPLLPELWCVLLLQLVVCGSDVLVDRVPQFDIFLITQPIPRNRDKPLASRLVRRDNSP
jgi:hypothetical protein